MEVLVIVSRACVLSKTVSTEARAYRSSSCFLAPKRRSTYSLVKRGGFAPACAERCDGAGLPAHCPLFALFLSRRFGRTQPHAVLGVYVYAKPVLGKDLHELEGDFLLDPADLPTAPESGGGGGGGGGGAEAVFYGDESGGSEVRTYVRALLCKRIAKAECGIRPLCIVSWLAV